MLNWLAGLLNLGAYHQLVWEESWLVGEAPEQLLLARRRRAGELAFGEPWEVTGQEQGPDRVGVRHGAEGPGDGGRAAGVQRRRERDNTHEEILRQSLHLACGRRCLRMHALL